MAKIEEAFKRNFSRKYICKSCKAAIRADPLKIIAKKVACRNCGFKSFRAPRKK
tara:strand:+ start:3119 stop:3280 length:162 start_codon:yes stop_codon:yes gene_type:complete